MSRLCDRRFLEALAAEYGFSFRKSLGQNFLIDETVPERMAEYLPEGVSAVEIGVGAGALTEALCARCEKVVGIEADKSLEALQRAALAGCRNVQIVYRDALKCDFAALCREMFSGAVWLAANLPYNITTEAAEKIALAGCFAGALVMVQKEAAERLCAAPGTRAACEASCLVQSECTPQILFTVLPQSFYPAPHVESAVMRLDFSRPGIEDKAVRRKVQKLVKGAFLLRRKTLTNALCSYSGGAITKEQTAEALTAIGLRPDARGETLTLADFEKLAAILPV